MIQVRRASDRGHTKIDWLDSRHTFSFADYHDPAHMGFRALRVINDDRVAPGRGFGTHFHRDMEILSCVLEGRLEHKDGMGNGSIIQPGDLQRMSAGRGVEHSEFNPSSTAPVHFLQIWITPAQRGLPPSYEQKTFPKSDLRDRLRLVASRDGRDGSVTIHQDADVHLAALRPDGKVEFDLRPGRGAWIHVARGSVQVNGTPLAAGDGASTDSDRVITIVGADDAEIVLFDLGPAR